MFENFFRQLEMEFKGQAKKNSLEAYAGSQ